MRLFKGIRAWFAGDDLRGPDADDPDATSTISFPDEDDDTMFERGSPKVIIGLGNPGQKYAQTRHNMGFMVVDELARRTHAPESRTRFKAEISETSLGEHRLILVQPQTFMNESGRAVGEVIRWYKLQLEDVLVVVDDLDIGFGQVRLRARGSAGGHNGLKSIIQHLGTEEFPRLRVGIGRGHPQAKATAHVLSRFSKEEQPDAERMIGDAADTAETWVQSGITEAMNRVNASGAPKKESTAAASS